MGWNIKAENICFLQNIHWKFYIYPLKVLNDSILSINNINQFPAFNCHTFVSHLDIAHIGNEKFWITPSGWKSKWMLGRADLSVMCYLWYAGYLNSDPLSKFHFCLVLPLFHTLLLGDHTPFFIKWHGSVKLNIPW
jgi:hypothetical protein